MKCFLIVKVPAKECLLFSLKIIIQWILKDTVNTICDNTMISSMVSSPILNLHLCFSMDVSRIEMSQ